jgi:MFS family permease
MLAVMVSLFSWSNCVGRLVVGRASDRDIKRGRPRALWLMYACAAMGVAHLLMAFNGLFVTVFAVVIAGGAYGSFWTLDPTCVADFFPQSLFGQVRTCALVFGLLLWLCRHVETGLSVC